MRSRTRGSDTAGPKVAGLRAGYVAERAHVDAAHTKMRALAAAPHAPAEARLAAQELTDALRQATTTILCVLRLLEPASPARHRLPRRRLATRSVPADMAAWSAELLRLTQIGVWLRRTTLDELGVHVPTSVRVGSRAANGPHIAGMIADPDDLVGDTMHEPRIGVDLQAVVDGGAELREPTDAAALRTGVSATAKAA
jgi:hypothetical protein